MPDDPVNTMLVTLRARLDEYERRRQEPQSSQLMTIDEQFDRRLCRLLKDPNVSVREIEDFSDELKVSWFGNGGRTVPPEQSNALKAKIDLVQTQPKKNGGGRPPKLEKVDLAFAGFAALYSNKVKSCKELHKYLREWYGTQGYSDDEQLTEKYLNTLIKDVVEKFHNDPDIELMT